MRFHLTCCSIALLVTPLLASCATSPPPKVVMENALTRVEIRGDERATRPHTHPISISPETMRALLRGMRIQVQTDRLIGVAKGWSAPLPVFSPADISASAGPLAEALAQAAPNEIVTFYRRVSDASIGLAFTTGGLFVQDGLVYVVMANFWSLPADAIIRDVPGYMIDPIDRPLLTLGRKFYLLSHTQEQAEVHLPDWQERHAADKTLVVNLSLLRPDNGHAAPRTNP